MKKNSFKPTNFKNLRQAFALLVLLLSGSLTGCELLPGEGRPIGCFPKPDILPCGTYVTAESITCGGGEFGNIWLKLDDGNYLQPFENATQVTSLEAGKRYRIGFDYINPSRPHSNQLVCLAVVPPSKPIRLQCIMEEEPAGACDTYATATHVRCGIGAWGDTWLKLENGEYLQPWANHSGKQQLTEGKRYKVGFQPMQKDSRYDNQVICHALPAVSLAWNPKIVAVTCLEEQASQTAK